MISLISEIIKANPAYKNVSLDSLSISKLVPFLNTLILLTSGATIT
jgi:hypothetical protein